MNGYIAQRRGRFYVVIYEGRDRSPERNSVAGTPGAPTERKPNGSSRSWPARRPVGSNQCGR
jgi:hypothetical protein